MTFLDQLMLPQLAIGALETAFNGLIQRSPKAQPLLRKLAGKVLHFQFKQPNTAFFIVFSPTQTDWLSRYTDEPDCQVQLALETLPKLADKSRLSQLINDKALVLYGDLAVLQHFASLLEQLEKNPAELLSPYLGDVLAELSSNAAKGLFHQFKQHFAQQQRYAVENLLNERPVLVHRLQLVDFYDQVEELEKQVQQAEARLNLLTSAN